MLGSESVLASDTMIGNEVPILEMHNVSKTFGAVKALTDVSLTIRKGETHSLMGENGAGKSTLMKILSGAYTADAGSKIFIDGQPILMGNLAKSRALGVAVIYQELALSPNLTVAQNIHLGHEKSKFGLLNDNQTDQEVQKVLDRLGVKFTPNTIVGDLSLGERQMVEIARALSADARIIVMDEPTTSLSSRETEKLFEIIQQLKEAGIAIIYISHRMEEVYRLSDKVSVLRDGAYVGTLDKEDIKSDTLVSMMVGRDIGSFYVKDRSEETTLGDVVLSVKDMGDNKRVFNCSFEAHAGEVLGIAGLVGSGRTELARLIYGIDKKTSGEVVLAGQKLAIKSPRDAIAAGITYLTEDRKVLGLFLDMSVSGNVNVSVVQDDSKRGGVLDNSKAKKRTLNAIRAFGIRAASSAINVGALSGGNQQKVLLARLLETCPKALILDEPTRGVDVGAKAEIYRIINELAKQGVAIVVISSDLPELIGISDRILVMREGKISGEVASDNPEKPFSQESVMALAIS